jgi:hypothetical protein
MVFVAIGGGGGRPAPLSYATAGTVRRPRPPPRGFGGRTFCRKTFAERTFCRTDFSPKRHFAERSISRKYILLQHIYYRTYFIKSVLITGTMLQCWHCSLGATRDGSGGMPMLWYGCCHKVSTRVESLPEHSAIWKFAISLRTVNMFYHSQNEICLRRCLFIRLFVYDLTSKHVPNRWVICCTNKLSISMVMHC